MKIQFFGNQTFQLTGKKVSALFNPQKATEVDIALYNELAMEVKTEVTAKKTLSLPGEFEVSGSLISGVATDGNANVAFKIDVDEIICAHLGQLAELPIKTFYEKLGENIDVLILPVSETIDGKKAKEIIEKISPRMVFIGGDKAKFPEVREACGAKVVEENKMTLSRSQFSDDATEIYILSE